MNINATAASRVVWIMDNNRAEQFSEEDFWSFTVNY